MELVVRKASAEDAEALAEVLTQAMHYKLARKDTAWDSVPYTTQELEKRIAKGNTYAAFLDDTLVATCLLLWEDEMMWGKQPMVAVYVHQLAVKDGYHGKGIGRPADGLGQSASSGKRPTAITYRFSTQ